MKKTAIKLLEVSKILTLKRNPQYLTPKQMGNLKASIERDGFVVPILVRPLKGGMFESISGNHRLMAAVALKLKKVPCVISKMSDREAKRLAINLNTIHGNANPELLAPFLAEMDESLLAEIHLEDADLKELAQFDKSLAETLSKMEAPKFASRSVSDKKNIICKCPKCGRKHLKP